MPLVSAKCTNCGANLNVDNTKDAWICDYCHSAFIVEKAINNYNITNNNNIRANVVNIYGGNTADFVIRAGRLEKYTGASTDVVIPNSVRFIGDYSFEQCDGLTSITIPKSVTSIGYRAFFHCNSLTSVTIPNSVTSIEGYAFEGCDSLTSVILQSGLSKIGHYAFCGCGNLANVTIPNSVTSIEECAFTACTSLTSVTIPNSVTSIGECAFAGCTRLMNVTISNSVTSFAVNTFNNTPYQRMLSDQWCMRNMSEGKCRYCGSEFKGVFKKTCSSCGKPKDY